MTETRASLHPIDHGVLTPSCLDYFHCWRGQEWDIDQAAQNLDCIFGAQGSDPHSKSIQVIPTNMTTIVLDNVGRTGYQGR